MMTSLPNPCVFVGTYTYLPLGPVPLPRPLHPPSPPPPLSLPLLRFHSPPNSSSFSPQSAFAASHSSTLTTTQHTYTHTYTTKHTTIKLYLYTQNCVHNSETCILQSTMYIRNSLRNFSRQSISVT